MHLKIFSTQISWSSNFSNEAELEKMFNVNEHRIIYLTYIVQHHILNKLNLFR